MLDGCFYFFYYTENNDDNDRDAIEMQSIENWSLGPIHQILAPCFLIRLFLYSVFHFFHLLISDPMDPSYCFVNIWSLWLTKIYDQFNMVPLFYFKLYLKFFSGMFFYGLFFIPLDIQMIIINKQNSIEWNNQIESFSFPFIFKHHLEFESKKMELEEE